MREIGKSERTIDVFGMLPPEEIAVAPEFLKRRIIDFAASLIRREKINQLDRGIGANGKRLPRVKKKSRPDGAKGPPLSPHDALSRSQKWCRAVPGYKAGTVAVSWSHGWLTILGYHAEGRVRGAPVRNVLEFPPSILSRIENAIQLHWLGLVRTHIVFFLHVSPAFPMPSRLAKLPPVKPEPQRKPGRFVETPGIQVITRGPSLGGVDANAPGAVFTGWRQRRRGR